jgi:hypothetical protein
VEQAAADRAVPRAESEQTLRAKLVIRPWVETRALLEAPQLAETRALCQAAQARPTPLAPVTK